MVSFGWLWVCVVFLQKCCVVIVVNSVGIVFLCLDFMVRFGLCCVVMFGVWFSVRDFSMVVYVALWLLCFVGCCCVVL